MAVFSLDEFYPIRSTEQQSRNYRIHEEFINHIDILPENVHIPDGTIPEERISEYCDSYERAASRIDLMIIGVGEDGQIGFNEPGSYSRSRTRLVQAHLQYPQGAVGRLLRTGEHPPKMAITMGIETIMRADRIILMAWGENKTQIVQKVVEGEITGQVPASYLQAHPQYRGGDRRERRADAHPRADAVAGGSLRLDAEVRAQGRGMALRRRAQTDPETHLQRTTSRTRWANCSNRAAATTRSTSTSSTTCNTPSRAGRAANPTPTTRRAPWHRSPFPKRVVIFSPHPDDDVISMGGTFIRLVQQGHDVHVAYETSGNVAVHDDVVLQNIDTSRELGYGDHYAEVGRIIAGKKKGEPEPRALLDLKGSIRRAEARAAVRSFGLNPDTNAHFLNLPFYETGGIKKGQLTEKDIEIIVKLLREIKPHQIYAAGDLADPHGTHRTCMEAVLAALEVVRDDEWMKDCHLWLYRGAWMEWEPGHGGHGRAPVARRADHEAPRHLPPPVAEGHHALPGRRPPASSGSAPKSARRTPRNSTTRLGMAEYQAIEVFVKMF